MKKVPGRSVLVLIIIAGVIGLLFDQGQITINDVPKDVPIINGKVVSAKTFRSDELKRGIEVVIQTDLSLQEAAQYYDREFAKRDIRAFGLPTFHGNSRELETATEASGGGETKNNQQVMVYLLSKGQYTSVTIAVLGNSIFFLPK